MKKYIFFLISLLFLNTVYSQVLYDETFDNLTLGDLTTDPIGAASGQDDWYVRLMGITDAKIMQEPNRVGCPMCCFEKRVFFYIFLKII